MVVPVAIERVRARVREREKQIRVQGHCCLCKWRHLTFASGIHDLGWNVLTLVNRDYTQPCRLLTRTQRIYSSLIYMFWLGGGEGKLNVSALFTVQYLFLGLVELDK